MLHNLCHAVTKNSVLLKRGSPFNYVILGFVLNKAIFRAEAEHQDPGAAPRCCGAAAVEVKASP